jgi:hypothetical protein
VNTRAAAPAKERLMRDDPAKEGRRDAKPEGGLPAPETHVHAVVTSGSIPAETETGEASRRRREFAEIALAFCKECRGWENARCINDWGYPYIAEPVSRSLASTKIPPYERQFHYTHLDKVMAAVRKWLRPADITPAHHARVFAIMPDLFSRFFVGSLDEAGLCYELMEACVAAERWWKENPAYVGHPTGQEPA